MYRTFGRPEPRVSRYDSDVEHNLPEATTDAAFKAQADLVEGCNGRAAMNVHFDNTETNSNALAPKSELMGGFDMSEVPVEGNAGDAKHWIRGAKTKL